MDLTLEDNNCFSTLTPTVVNITVAMSAKWTLIANVKSEIHTEIALGDASATYTG